MRRRPLLAGIVETGTTLATSAINLAEVYAGTRPEEEAATEAFLGSLVCYPVTDTIARRAGRMKSAFARSGKTFSLADMLIAATALEHGLQLMTDNQKDFPVAELMLYPLERGDKPS